jgi:hypothetical protein
MDNEDMQKMLEAMLSKRDKESKKYPGPEGGVIRWKRQMERKAGDKKIHKYRLWTRLTEELRSPPEYIIVKETPPDDKDKDNKDKDKDKKHVYSNGRGHRNVNSEEKGFQLSTTCQPKVF